MPNTSTASSLHRPIFYTRTFLYVLIPLLALDAVFLSHLPRAAFLAGTVFLAAAQVPGLLHAHAVPGKENWRDAASLLERGVGADECVIVQPGYLFVNLEYYGVRRVRFAEDDSFDREWGSRRALQDDVLGSAGGVWLVTRNGQDGGWIDLLAPSFERKSCFRSRSAQVYHFLRRRF